MIPTGCSELCLMNFCACRCALAHHICKLSDSLPISSGSVAHCWICWSCVVSVSPLCTVIFLHWVYALCTSDSLLSPKQSPCCLPQSKLHDFLLICSACLISETDWDIQRETHLSYTSDRQSEWKGWKLPPGKMMWVKLDELAPTCCQPQPRKARTHSLCENMWEMCALTAGTGCEGVGGAVF